MSGSFGGGVSLGPGGLSAGIGGSVQLGPLSIGGSVGLGVGGGLFGGPGMGSAVMIRTRQLDIIIPDCAIDEHHRDRLTITNHPVEMGAPITDHAFKEAEEVNLRYGWANSAGGNEGYVADVYQQLLFLQTERRPFTIVTGKRQYRNMLIAELSVTTDPTTEYVLMASITCREVILVQLSKVSAKKDQKQPEKTAKTEDKGDKKVKPTDKPSNSNVGNSNAQSTGTANENLMRSGDAKIEGPVGGDTAGKGVPVTPQEMAAPPTSAGAVDEFGRTQPAVQGYGSGAKQGQAPSEVYGPPPTYTDMPTIVVRPPSTSFQPQQTMPSF